MTAEGKKSWLSPTRWIAGLSNLLLRWVCQRTILIFLGIEILMSSFLLYWFWKHKKVAMLGIYAVDWKTYGISFGMRIVIAGFGMYTVFIRRIQLTKIYYGVFFLAAFMALWTVIPVHSLTCRCTDYLQCAVVATFADKGAVLNPFWEPDVKKFEPKRKVPFKEPPTEPNNAILFKEELLVTARKKANKPVEGIILETEASVKHIRHRRARAVGGRDEAVMVESLAHGHGRLMNNRRTHNTLMTDHTSVRPEALPAAEINLAKAASLIESAEGDFPMGSDEDIISKSSRHLSQSRGMNKDGGNSTSSGQAEDAANKMDEEVARHPMQFFNMTEPDLTWVGNEAPWCESKVVKHPNSVKKLKWRLMRAKDEEDIVLDEFLASKLFVCAIDSGCGVVSAEVLEEPDGSCTYKVCQHSLQLVPVSKNDQEAIAQGVPQQVGPNAIFFQRNPVTVRFHLESSNAKPNNFYKYAFRQLESGAAVKMLRTLQRTSCVCDYQDNGCQTYEDSLGENKFWCYVKESRRKRCVDDGFTLFWDPKEERIWSEEICQEAGCACSELGMHPSDLKDPNLNRGLLHKNRMNYGSECQAWNQAPPGQWCFVGWDSTCPDRVKSSTVWVSNDNPRWPSIYHQYKSRLPCQVEAQVKMRERSAEVCEDITRIVEFFMFLELLMFMPMTVIIFKFLSNRCGDEFQCEEQFAVVLSTDEEESEDEWERGATQDKKDTRGDSDNDDGEPSSQGR